MSPEYLHIGLTLLLFVLGGYQVFQNTNIKLGISKVETGIEKRLAEMREWSRETFVSKHDQMHLLEMVARRDEKTKTG